MIESTLFRAPAAMGHATQQLLCKQKRTRNSFFENKKL
jgi:hypothetical protein